MPTFIVRIQLIEPESDDYPPLWEALAARGFHRTIISIAGDSYRLPHGTYRFDDPAADVATVRRSALEAVIGIRCQARILVIQVTASQWSGLDKDDDAWTKEFFAGLL